MSQKAEGLCQLPLGERVGRETRMYQCQSAGKVGIGEVREVAAQLPAGEHTLVDDVLCGERADIESLTPGPSPRGEGSFRLC